MSLRGTSKQAPASPPATEMRARLRRRLGERLQLTPGVAASNRPPSAPKPAPLKALPVHNKAPAVRYVLDFGAAGLRPDLLERAYSERKVPKLKPPCAPVGLGWF